MTTLTVPDRPHIGRRTGDPADDSFESLRAQGIQLIEQLARFNWTDYNEHDPGVTILEQVCYALTDVMYRAGFPVEDLLAGETGGIDWGAQGLLPAEYAFPCRPTTVLDYEAVLYDAFFEEVENVQVEAPGGDGLYRILLRLRVATDGLPITERAVQTLIDRVRQTFASVRNLGEDLDEVRVLDMWEHDLSATVEIADRADPAQVLARIYSACAKKIAAGLRFEPFPTELSAGASPEEAFRGPFTRFGVVTGDSGPSLRQLTEQDIYGVIAGLEDVVSVNVESPPAPPPGSAVLRLHVPRSQSEIKVVILNRGRRIQVPWHDFMMRYNQEHSFTRVVPYSQDEISAQVPRPQGRRRQLSEYQSIQNLFPANYGLGPRNLPASARTERKAQVHQLQAWLLFFDQHLADYLSMLAGIRDLFSLFPPRHSTYFSQVLTPDNVPGIEDLYADDPAKVLGELLDDRDHRDRTKRLLDYLLALYGETFRDVSRYAPKPEKGSGACDPIIDGRLACLTEIGALTRDRAAGANAYEPAGESNLSGLENRLNRLLGFSTSGARVRLIEHILLRPSAASKVADQTPDDDFYRFRVTLLLPKPNEEDDQFIRFAEDTLDSNCPAHICPTIRWVAADELAKFDEAYVYWWTLRRQVLVAPPLNEQRWSWNREDESAPAAKLDAAALELAKYVRGPGKWRT